MIERFLSSERIYELWAKIKSGLAEKQDKLTPDKSVTLDGSRISVTLPTVSLSAAEYEALSKEEKQKPVLYAIPERDCMPADANGAVPTGAVIGFMALSAPDGYLLCDGSICNISEFPRLATYLEKQFGLANYFGGNGTTTFAVPDMRNLFLRGYHGTAGEQLSGNVGLKQEATSHSGVMSGIRTDGSLSLFSESKGTIGDYNSAKNPDTRVYATQNGYVNTGKNTVSQTSDINLYSYTSRPVNMAVLYCIKT